MSVKGSRAWINDIQNILHEHPECTGSDNETKKDQLGDQLSVFREILIQGKKISQIICYIWNEGEGAEILDKYFRGEDESKNLSDLLYASKEKQSSEYELLAKVFSKNLDAIPIFKDEEGTPRVMFDVSVEKFEGSLNDPRPSQNKTLFMTIPYPPRPQTVETGTKGYAPIKKEELENWVADQIYHPTNEKRKIKYFPSNPYLPASTS